MTDPLAEVLARRAEEIRERIAAAGGDTTKVKVLAVSKTRTAAEAQAAVEAGLVDLGENYSQEIEAKAPEVAGARWHMIGGLQTNKIKRLAPFVSLWQTVDRIKLGDEIAKRAPGASVLIQVNTSGEPQKSGCEPGSVAELRDHLVGLGLSVEGLMTVGPTSPDLDPRPCFALLRQLASKLEVSELSMGMSGDLEAAIQEGSTMVRIGTALFGQRVV